MPASYQNLKKSPEFRPILEFATDTASNGTDDRRRIELLVLPGFQVMCFTAFSVFEVANKKIHNAVYDLHVVSEKGGPVPTSFGMNVSTEPIGMRGFDTLMIAVGMEIPSTPPGIVSYLKEASRTHETDCLDLPWFLRSWRCGPAA